MLYYEECTCNEGIDEDEQHCNKCDYHNTEFEDYNLLDDDDISDVLKEFSNFKE